MGGKTNELWYARRMTSLTDGPRKAVYLHREVLTVPVGMVVDHRDFDGLNNQKANLQICSYSDNGRKRRKTKEKKHSRYKGVTWNGKTWMVSIKNGTRSTTLGYFADEVDGALMYDIAAQVLFGEFAVLNGV